METVKENILDKKDFVNLLETAFIKPRSSGDHLYANRGDFFLDDLKNYDVIPSRKYKLYDDFNYKHRTINLPDGKLVIIYAYEIK